MKASKLIRLFLLPFVVIHLLSLTGCHKKPSAHGDADVTLAYWNRLNEERPDSADISAAMAGWAVVPGSDRSQLMRMDGFFAIQIKGITERNQKLGQLPMQNVDPVLLNYTTELAAANTTCIETLSQARQMVRQILQITSPDQLGLDFFGSFLRHANEKEPLLAMLGDQWSEKSKTVGEMIPQARDIQSKMQSLESLSSKLDAAEIAVRASLHQNHARDFKPSSAFDKEIPKPTDLERVFTQRRLMLDLLGQNIYNWTFEKLEEFRAIEIKRRSQTGNRAELDLKCDVVGANAGPRSLTFTMIYELRGDTWVLLALSAAK